MSQRTTDDQFSLAALSADQVARLASAAKGRPVCVAGTSVRPIGYDWGSPATAGLWRVDVREARDAGARAAVSFFVKLLRHPRLWPGLSQLPDEESRKSFIDAFPWRFELDMYEAGIAGALPPGLRVPVLHTARHTGTDYIALWSDFVDTEPGPWQLSDYRHAAYLLGRMAARRRDGAAVNANLPDICRVGLPGRSLRFYASTRVFRAVRPSLRDGALWRHPVVAAALARAGDPELPAEMSALAERVPAILDMLDGLPQTHAHGDASPQNLLRPRGEPGTLVVIDWGFGDLLPIGFDLGQLLVGLAHAGETDPGELTAIDAAIFPAYLDGLADEDYEVDPRLVRAGYVGGLAARSALCGIPVELLAASAAGRPDGGQDLQELFASRLRLTRVMIDLAKELDLGVLARVPVSG
jgi:Phosphotransferase enzyme family